MAQVTILGSGTLLPDDDHRSAAHLVERDGLRFLLDCGSGTVHGLDRHGIQWRELTHVALSHFHTDHIGDLPALLWALKHGVGEERIRPLTLLGPPGLRTRLEAMVQAFGDYILDPGFPVEVVELRPEGGWLDGEWDLELRCHPANHTPEALAFRIQAGGVSVGYTGDTGPHPPLAGFFHEVDVLICECAISDGAPAQPHLSPQDVAALARDARPRALILTHLYPEVERDGLADLVRTLGYTGDVLVARDGLRRTIPDPARRPETGGGHRPDEPANLPSED
jgi:ribonuclease BN (tRNA processing enzyme)